MIKREAGPERLGQHHIPPPPPRPQQRWVWGLPLVSLEMIAYPAARREEAHQLHTLRTFMKRKLLFNFFLLKPTFLYPLVAFMNPRFGPVGEERDVCHFTRTVNHLSHYPDRRTVV